MSQQPASDHFSGLRYFSHLGALGASDVHALRAQASAALMSALQLEANQRVLEMGCVKRDCLRQVVSARAQAQITCAGGCGPLRIALQIARRRRRDD